MMRASSRRRLLWVLALLLVVVAGSVMLLLPAPGRGSRSGPLPPRYVGARACEDCHAEEAQRWRGSHHDLAMQEAGERTVLGDFADVRFSQGGVNARLFRKSGEHRVRTEGPDGRSAEFPIAYTFGVEPIQQYLVPLAAGRFQVLGVAWDSRPAAAGGGRWFAPFPEAAGHRHPLHWTKPSQNWNSGCSDCHSTNVRKGFRLRDNLFITTFSEIDVACEACHGAGSRHVEWARAARARGRSAGKDPGLIVRFSERSERRWALNETSGTARLVEAADTASEVETCARCHATRRLLSEDATPGRLLQQSHRPALLEEGLYFADGQTRDEPFTWGSFLQSRMYAAGVRCADCHDAHDLKLRAEGDAVCLACHAQQRFATRRHHFHRESGRGASCIGCHMSERTSMVVDDRHDHSFRVPRPDLTASLGEGQAPNTCNGCHRERGAQWAARVVRRWYPEGRSGTPHYAQALHLGRSHGPGAAIALAALVRDPGQPAIVRATAVSLLAEPSAAASLALLQKASADPEPLVRMAVASRLATLAPADRVRAGVTLLWDPVLAVRVEAVPAFADVPDASLASEQRAAFDRALDEYYLAQRANAERPEAHVHLGTVHAKRGRADEARRDFDTALRLAPGSLSAGLGLADLLLGQGQGEEAEAVLRRAVKANAQSPAAHRALGQILAARKRPAESLRELQRASELAPEDPALAHDVRAGPARGGPRRRGARRAADGTASRAGLARAAAGAGDGQPGRRQVPRRPGVRAPVARVLPRRPGGAGACGGAGGRRHLEGAWRGSARRACTLMALDPQQIQQWAHEHKAAWELLPLIEMHGHARVQIGFHLELYARLPEGLEPAERDRTLPELWDRLRDVAESLVPEAGADSRLEVEPFDAAGRLRPETGFAPEVLLAARLVHASDYFAPVDENDRRRLVPIEDRLRELGFRERSW